ncbi:MAG: nucleotide sugar epimerase, partial [Candidatus Omnitrophica bacterium]|nr:nucleotide sugar epimerase [Candidatus Omnitrophota bacterium]
DINLASGKEIKIIELAQIINKFTRNKSGIKFVNKRKWDTKTRLLASVEKAKRLIGYIPKMNFEDGIKETIKWFKDNWENILKSADFGPGISSAVREIYAEKK